MATVSVEVSGNALAFFKQFRDPKLFERSIWRATTRAQRDIARLYVRHLKQAIRETTIRRTGSLLSVKTRVHRYRPRLELRINPDFPKTFYRTEGSRPRQGQYAFVVNSHRHFIEMATRRTQADPEVQAIFNKHLGFIIEQLKKKAG